MSRTIIVEQELRLPHLVARLIRMDLPTPTDDFLAAGDALLTDLCLTPRPAGAQARFVNHWSPSRYEAVGQVFIVPPREILQFRAPAGRQVALACELQPALLAPWFDGLDWSERRLEASLDIGSARIPTLMRFLAHELRYPSLGQEVVVDLLGQHICIELARHLQLINEPAMVGGLAAWRLHLIDDRLALPGPSPTLVDLAHLCNISVRQLTRGFRVSRGYSIGEYVIQHRMDMARRLLAGEESIKAIAHRVGFASASSFSVAFRRSTGTTPRLFRARVLRGI